MSNPNRLIERLLLQILHELQKPKANCMGLDCLKHPVYTEEENGRTYCEHHHAKHQRLLQILDRPELIHDAQQLEQDLGL